MKENRRIIDLDNYEEDVVVSALNDTRNDKIAENKSTDSVDDVILKILHAPVKKVKVRNEAR